MLIVFSTMDCELACLKDTTIIMRQIARDL